MIPKRQRIKSKRLQEAPRHESCVICGAQPCIGVAHLPHNAWGVPSGMGAKCDDIFGAHLCQTCHDYADGPEGRNDFEWRGRALCLTLRRLFDRGVLLIQGEENDYLQDDLPF